MVASLPVSNPLSAYALDLDARPGATSLGPDDARWLALAIALDRMATLSPGARAPYVANLRDAFADTDLVAVLLSRAAAADAEHALSALHGIVEDMENHHAFHLAFATLAAARTGAPDRLTPLHDGRLAAHQARVARQLGDLETAEDLYATAMELGVEHDAPELLVRAHVGAGLIAETRGNYPAARREYHRALEHAKAAPRIAALAHHGLMVAASTAGDLDTALRHAWAAFECVAGDAVRRVDLLINLAELARKAGDPAVALRAFRQALAHTDLSRFRLPALGGAAQAAAALGDAAAVASLASEAEHEAASNAIPYESAKLWLELAQAFAVLGDAPRVSEYARRVEEIATAHAFHELELRASDLAEAVGRRPATTRATGHPDPETREILRRLDDLAGASRAVLVG